MSDSARTMVHFPVEGRLFNYRVAAIALRQGHVLICHEDDDDYVMLPGGRVEMGEPSPVALAREIAEELRSPATIGRLVYTVENFFEHEGRQVHELGAYYLIELPPTFPFRSGGVVFEAVDAGVHLHFEWIDLAGDGLPRRHLRPRFMIEKLRHIPPMTEHVICHEGHK